MKLYRYLENNNKVFLFGKILRVCIWKDYSVILGSLIYIFKNEYCQRIKSSVYNMWRRLIFQNIDENLNKRFSNFENTYMHVI